MSLSRSFRAGHSLFRVPRAVPRLSWLGIFSAGAALRVGPVCQWRMSGGRAFSLARISRDPTDEAHRLQR